MIRFRYTILYVKNVVASIEFYEKAFQCERKFIAPDQSYGELNTGDTTLSFAAHSLAESNMIGQYSKSDISNQPFGIEIGFTTKDVDAVVQAAIAAGAVSESEPKEKPWGQVVAYVRDPDGFLVEICTPMS